MDTVRQRGPSLAVGPAIERFVKVLETGRLTEGPFLREFEERISETAGRGVFAVSSGAAALDIAFEAVRSRRRPFYSGGPRHGSSRPGSRRPIRVGVPTVGHWTDYAAVVRAGHEVVWLPVDEYGSLDVEAVDLSDLDVVLWILIGGWWDSDAGRRTERRCAAAGVTLVIDASHATGNLSILGHGDFAVASLFATKCLTTGEGGLVSAREDSALVRSLRDGGRDADADRTGREPWINIGTDRRMPETSAVVGLASLDSLDGRMHSRYETLVRYRSSLPESLRLVDTGEGLYKALVVAPDAATADRFRTHLGSWGVIAPSGVFDLALPDMGRSPSSQVGTAVESGRAWSACHVALPFHESMPGDEVAQVCHALEQWS